VLNSFYKQNWFPIFFSDKHDKNIFEKKMMLN